MNLGIISFHCCPFSLLGGDGTGGMNVYLRELSSFMTRFPEVSVDIFTRIQNPKTRIIKNISPKVRVIHLKGGPEHPLNRKHLYEYLPEFARNLEEFIFRNRRKYDLVYSHYWLSGLIGERIRQKHNIPFVQVFHTLAFLKQRAAKKRYDEHPSRLKAEEHLAHVSDSIISSSEHEKKSLLEEYEIFPSKIKVIHPGVNKGLFYPLNKEEARTELGLKGEDRIILYVGRIEPVKGLFTLVEALELAKGEAPLLYSQLKLLVVGGGNESLDHIKNPEILRMRNVIKEKRLKDKILFLGSKKQNKLKKFYSAADALVMPSLYESFGLVVIEALACGTPVIASKIGEMMNIIKEGKNGFYFSPYNSSSMLLCLNHFFNQDNSLWVREKIRQDIVRRFSWKKTAEETYDFFREIIDKDRSTTRIFRPDESPQPA